MIYISWLYYDMKCFPRCSLLLWILLLVIAIFDLAMSSQMQHRDKSQGSSLTPLSGRILKSDFCSENRNLFLSDTSIDLEMLSSKVEPSNQKSPSSRNVFLPQGSLKNFTFTPNFRFKSSSLMPFLPNAGCISLRNYYWKYDTSSIEEDSLFGVQIFIFHIYNNSNTYVNINLRILLHSTQDAKLLRPVAIVLSSSLPRKFYLSVLSYLSHTQQPIHIIMTHKKSDIIIMDQNLNDMDLARIHISVLDSSYNNIFHSSTLSSDDSYLLEIREKISTTNLFKFGNFSGYNYNSISSVQIPETLWLFDNGIGYSKLNADIKLVALYLVFKDSNAIDLVLGRPEERPNLHNYEFYQDQCTIVKYENHLSLSDRIMTYGMSSTFMDKSQSCSYYINSSRSAPGISKRYRTVTWLHLEKTSNVTVFIKLTSNRLYRKDENHLFIVTADNVKGIQINVESFFLYKKVDIISNISLSQFDQGSRQSSFLISVKLINTSAHDVASQNQNIANYIAASPFAVMQTNVYKLMSTEPYEFQVNIDDSQSNSGPTINVGPSCWCNPQSNIAPRLWIDMNAWKRRYNWTPTQFLYGNRNRMFKKINETTFMLEATFRDCSSKYHLIQQKVYGILDNRKYLLKIDFKYNCVKVKSKKVEKIIVPVTTVVSTTKYIDRSQDGFNVFNDSRFKTELGNELLHDKSILFVQLMQNIAWEISLKDGIHLRDCYLTNQMATEDDLQYPNQSSRNFKKVLIVKGGCINDTISNIDDSMKQMINYQFLNKNLIYRFPLVIDADRWASSLSLHRQWLYDERMEVHLYCGINRCYTKKTQVSDPLADVEECSTEKECLHESSSQQIFKYFGPLSITRKGNVIVKISILTFLSLVTGILVLLLIVFIRHVRTIQSKLKHNRCPTIDNDYQEPSCPEKLSIKLVKNQSLDSVAYHSVQLSDSLPKPLPEKSSQPCSSSSLLQLLVENDKSLILRASYLPSTTTSDPVQSSADHSHSSMVARHVTTTTQSDNNNDFVDRPIYSWPLSSIDHARRSNHSQSSSQQLSPPSRLSVQATVIRDRFRLTLSNKSKISVTVTSMPCSSSNQKMSSNRTTVSGESASASEMTANKSYKWWSPLSNCSLKKSFVESRN